jgi:hypothetical protein
MQKQTNTIELTQVELTTLSGGEGYAPKSEPTDTNPWPNPEEMLKPFLLPVYY